MKRLESAFGWVQSPLGLGAAATLEVDGAERQRRSGDRRREGDGLGPREHLLAGVGGNREASRPAQPVDFGEVCTGATTSHAAAGSSGTGCARQGRDASVGTAACVR